MNLGRLLKWFIYEHDNMLSRHGKRTTVQKGGGDGLGQLSTGTSAAFQMMPLRKTTAAAVQTVQQEAQRLWLSPGLKPGFSSQAASLTSRRHKPGRCPRSLGGEQKWLRSIETQQMFSQMIPVVTSRVLAKAPQTGFRVAEIWRASPVAGPASASQGPVQDPA